MKVGMILRPGIEADDLQRIVKEDFELDSMDQFQPPEQKQENDAENLKLAEKAQTEFEKIPQKQYDYLDKDKLYAALFTMADTWCPNIDPFEYKEFFKQLRYRLKYQGMQD